MCELQVVLVFCCVRAVLQIRLVVVMCLCVYISISIYLYIMMLFKYRFCYIYCACEFCILPLCDTISMFDSSFSRPNLKFFHFKNLTGLHRHFN